MDANTGATTSARRWARIGLVLFLVLLARHAFQDEYGAIPMLSDVDTAIHEFGHMFFQPFGVPVLGTTMVILGGTLFQVGFPLIFMLYFLWSHADGTQRDLYGAAVCLWWVSINMLGVAVYANDAQVERLMLINGATGRESNGHDWHNLFTIWGVLDKTPIIAARMRAVARMLCVISILAGLYIAWNDDTPAAVPAVNPP